MLNLEQQGYLCYLPLINVEKLRRFRVKHVSKPLFPRYLFIRLDSSEEGANWAPIHSTIGVSTLVQFGGQPAKASNVLIEQLQAHQETRPTSPLFSPGETMHIIDGAFVGLDAIYQCNDAEQCSLVLLELLHKQVKMQIDTTRLRKSA